MAKMTPEEIYAAVGAEPPKKDAPSPISQESMKKILSPKKKVWENKAVQITVILIGTIFTVFFILLWGGGGQKSSVAKTDREKQLEEIIKKNAQEDLRNKRSTALGNGTTVPQVAPVSPVPPSKDKPRNTPKPPSSQNVVAVQVPPTPRRSYAVATQPRQQVYYQPRYQPRSTYRSQPTVQQTLPQSNESAMEQWKRLSGLGSSGSGGAVSSSSMSNSFTPSYSPSPQVVSQLVPQGGSVQSSSLVPQGRSDLQASIVTSPPALLPVGATATARLQQSISWSPESSPSTPVLLELISDFKDRSGRSVMQKGVYLDGRIANSNNACYFDIEISKVGNNLISAGSISATSVQASYHKRGGPTLGDRLMNGLSNVGAAMASRARDSEDLATSAGGSIVTSVIGRPSRSNSPQSVACKVDAGKTIKLLVIKDAN